MLDDVVHHRHSFSADSYNNMFYFENCFIYWKILGKWKIEMKICTYLKCGDPQADIHSRPHASHPPLCPNVDDIHKTQPTAEFELE